MINNIDLLYKFPNLLLKFDFITTGSLNTYQADSDIICIYIDFTNSKMKSEINKKILINFISDFLKVKSIIPIREDVDCDNCYWDLQIKYSEIDFSNLLKLQVFS